MEWIKKNIWIVTTVFLIGTNAATVVFYGLRIDSNTEATKDNTDAVTILTDIIGDQKQWNEDHDKRHEDHIHLHEAERQ